MKVHIKKSKVLLLLSIFISSNVFGQKSDPVIYLNFDKMEQNEKITPGIYREHDAPDIERIFLIKDEISGTQNRIFGNFFKLVPGISGNALMLDGLTSFIRAENTSLPKITGDFSVGAWIALGGYPVHWCPVADQNSSMDKGFFFGIDAYGHAGFKIHSGGKQFEIISEERIPLRKWKHMEGIYSKNQGISLYIDGRLVKSMKTEGEFEPASGSALLIGKHSIRRKPEGTLRPKATEDVYTFLDGLIDELKIYNRRLSEKELSEYVSQSASSESPALKARALPAVPDGNFSFGAINTTLKYYDAWDALWYVGDEADIVVRFDNLPGKFFFWRGTSYIPHWVTENRIWYNNEFTETWSGTGCHEPMSDKRCQFSNVRILENNDARVVVLWRYALVDNWSNMVKVDTLTGWGEWTDEVYTIYPDGVAVREITLYSTQPESPHEFQEAILVMGPGQRPDDVLHPSALTLANLKGDTHTYSWEKGIPPEVDKKGYVNLPVDASIQLVNTKSEFKPFVIVNPQSKPLWDIYRGELRKELSMFPWWNHWPTSQNPSDGRYAMDSDQASHSSLSHITFNPYKKNKNSVTKLMLNGLTSKPADQLVPLAKSWVTPPKLKISDSDKYINDGYNPAERAYQISCKQNGSPGVLNISLEGSQESPVLNPCFVIKNWGRTNISMKSDNKNIAQGKSFRFGFRNSLEGMDLIVWIQNESVTEFKVSFIPVVK